MAVITDGRIITGSPTNILRGILGVASSWGTAPTSLSAITDGDVTTVTGEGSTTNSYTTGLIVFDMSTSKHVLVTGLVGLRSDAGSVYPRFDISEDNTNWILSGSAGVQETVTSTTEVKRWLTSKTLKGRYIRLNIGCSSNATTSYAKIYTVMAYEMGL